MQTQPQDATAAVLRAFDRHNIVMFGEAHGCKQEYDWLNRLVATPAFAERVDDIVVEFGNSLYQGYVDHFVAGDVVPLTDVQHAWRDVIGAIDAPSPVYESFYNAVRASNLKRRGRHQLRILLGGPPGDWDHIESRQQLLPFLETRDSFYARQVKEQVLNRKRRAFLIMGSAHFERTRARAPGFGLVERELREAGGRTYSIVLETAIYDDPRKRFALWPAPSIVELTDNWAAALPLFGAGYSGQSPTLGQAADALFFAARSRDELTVLNTTRTALEGTAFAKELDRRMLILHGRPLRLEERPETPLD